jgi:hypothetical protein
MQPEANNTDSLNKATITIIDDASVWEVDVDETVSEDEEGDDVLEPHPLIASCVCLIAWLRTLFCCKKKREKPMSKSVDIPPTQAL